MLILKGTLIESGPTERQILNRSFKFGDGLFETIRIFEGKALFLADHFERLFNGMQVLQMEFDPRDLESALRRDIQQLIDKKQIREHGYVRLQMFRDGGGDFGPIDLGASYLIEANALKNDPFLLQTGVHLVPYRALSLEPSMLSPFQLSQAVPYVMGKIHAQQSEADEALLFNGNLVSDSTAGNLFVIRQDKILSPPLDCAAQDRISRRQIFALCEELKIPLEEKKLKHKNLLQADELFIGNSIRGIIPVNQYAERIFPSEDQRLSRFIHNCFYQFVQKQG